jgi:hypothetical protein
MKAGTTSLFDWLGRGDDVALPPVKEPATLARPRFDASERAAYLALFDTPLVTGEASVRYGWPSDAPRVATRLLDVEPRPRLVFVVRDPVDRLRSDYRHNVLRGRERRPFAAAVADPSEAAVMRSCYSLALAAYESVLGDLPLLVRFEDLVGDDGAAWRAVLDHLGLDPRPRPDTVANRTSDRVATTALGRMAFDGRSDPRATAIRTVAAITPSSLRSVGRSVGAARRERRIGELSASAGDTLPAATTSALAGERERMRVRYGISW